MFARKMVLLTCLTVASFAIQPKPLMKKVVFSCKSGETVQFIRLLDHVTHLENHYETTKTPHDIVVVAQGECVKFMLNDYEGTRWDKEETPFEAELKLDKIKTKVRFEQCENTLDRMGIPKTKLRDFVKKIPSATISVVDYQLDGYAIMSQ